MSKPYKGFEPAWVKTAAPNDSWRSIFRMTEVSVWKVSGLKIVR